MEEPRPILYGVSDYADIVGFRYDDIRDAFDFIKWFYHEGLLTIENCKYGRYVFFSTESIRIDNH